MSYTGSFLSSVASYAGPVAAYAGSIIPPLSHTLIPLAIGGKIVSVYGSSLGGCKPVGFSSMSHGSSNPVRMIASIACFILGEAVSFRHSSEAGIYFTAGIAGGLVRLAATHYGYCRECKKFQ